MGEAAIFDLLLIYTFQEPLQQEWCVRDADLNSLRAKPRACGAHYALARSEGL